MTRPTPVPGISYRSLDYWCRTGLVRPEQARDGSGHHRRWPAAEVRAARALDALRRLAGVEPGQGANQAGGRGEGTGSHGAMLALRRTVAEIARTEAPGTAHEITTPVPWIHHVVIVPEDPR